MNILKLLLQNLRRGAVSYRFPLHHDTSEHYRGLIDNDETRCVGCGQCAYVCPSHGMEVHRNGDNYEWSYDPGKCTFCARCIDRCKLKTLTMHSERPPVYGESGELKQILKMIRKRAAPAAKPPAPAIVTTATLAASEAATPVMAMADTEKVE